MTQLLQGTTPKITFDLSNTGFTVSQITAAELTVESREYKLTLTLSDMTTDTANNKLSYQFTEVQTLKLNDNTTAYYQLYIKVGTEIYGTKKARCTVFEDIKGSVMT